MENGGAPVLEEALSSREGGYASVRDSPVNSESELMDNVYESRGMFRPDDNRSHCRESRPSSL